MDEIKSQEPVNVAVFVDYENVYKCLLEQNQNMLRLAFFEKLREWCRTQGKRVVKIAVYCNFDNTDLHESYHQSLLQSYGVETIHTANQGKNYADLKITIDVLTSIYSNHNIDEFFIMSNDKDMTPLLNVIRANKRNVSVITTGDQYNEALIAFADEHICLEQIVKTEVPHRVLDDIIDLYWRKFNRYIDEKILEFDKTGVFKEYALEYNLKNEIAFSKIMIYELANILLDLYRQGKVLFYHYLYNGRLYVAMLPTDKKDLLIQKGILPEDAILPDFDMESVVKAKYDYYKRLSD